LRVLGIFLQAARQLCFLGLTTYVRCEEPTALRLMRI
jgi:hypothetical protein